MTRLRRRSHQVHPPRPPRPDHRGGRDHRDHSARIRRRALAGVTVAALMAAATSLAWVAPAAAAPAADCLQYVTRIDPVTQQPTVVCVQWSDPPGHPANPEELILPPAPPPGTATSPGAR